MTNYICDVGMLVVNSICPWLNRIWPVVLIILSSGFYSAQACASQEEWGVAVRRPSPSPDGTQVVFEADFDGQQGLWVSNMTGTGLRKLTKNAEGDAEPAWSPRGDAIAFVSTRGGVSDIWLISPKGGSLVQLTRNQLNNQQPAWSPDGSKIAFVSARHGSSDIWIMNADGTGQRRLTSLPGHEDHPTFDPAGDRIAFSYTLGNGGSSLFYVATDGSAPVQVTKEGSPFRDWNPQWTSRGILFATDRDDKAGHFTPWMIQPNGSGLIQISKAPALDPVMLPSGLVIFSDDFSVSSQDGALSHITLLSPSNGAKQQVTFVMGLLLPVDVDGDGVVTCKDLAAVKASIGKTYGQPGFNPRADVNGDGIVNFRDVADVYFKLPAKTICP